MDHGALEVRSRTLVCTVLTVCSLGETFELMLVSGVKPQADMMRQADTHTISSNNRLTAGYNYLKKIR